MSKVILVLGATGNQGGATVDALLADPAAKGYTIAAVTRDPDSSSAKKLAAKSSDLKVVKGDLDHADALFSEAQSVTGQPVYAVFSVQGTGDAEETQGKAVVDAALKAGVKVFVYASVDRGGNEVSWNNPTPVPHFIAKHNVEQHLRKVAEGKPMDWSIIRPVAFMNNYEPSFKQTPFATAIRDTLAGGKSLQWVCAKDIGYFGAQHLLHPEKYSKQAQALAGDELTFDQISSTVERVKGQSYNKIFNVAAAPILEKIKGSDFGYMITWFGTDGYGAVIADLKKEHPGLSNFEEYLSSDTLIQAK